MGAYAVLFCYSVLAVLLLARASNAKSVIIGNDTDIRFDPSRAKRSSGFSAKGRFPFWNSDSNGDSDNHIDRDSDSDIGNRTDIHSSSSSSSDDLLSILGGLTKPRHIPAGYQFPDGATHHGPGHHRRKRNNKDCLPLLEMHTFPENPKLPTVNQLLPHPPGYCSPPDSVRFTYATPWCHVSGEDPGESALRKIDGVIILDFNPLRVSGNSNSKGNLIVVVIPRDLSAAEDSNKIPEMRGFFSLPLEFEQTSELKVAPEFRRVRIKLSPEFQQYMNMKTTKPMHLKVRFYGLLDGFTVTAHPEEIQPMCKINIVVDGSFCDESKGRIRHGGYERLI